jgi:hypothetical protein
MQNLLINYCLITLLIENSMNGLYVCCSKSNAHISLTSHSFSGTIVPLKVPINEKYHQTQITRMIFPIIKIASVVLS